MRRRQFSQLLGALVASGPFPVLGQSKDKPTVGVLILGKEADTGPWMEAVRKGLNEYGLIDGNTIRLVVRGADGRHERLADIAQELATEGSRVIVTSGTTLVSAAKRGAPEVPIVMAGSADPVMMGFAQSLARPGGRITGISILGEEFLGKQFQLLMETVPTARRFAAVLQAANPGNPAFRQVYENTARVLGVRIDVREIRAAEDFASAFDWAVQQSADGVHVILDPVFMLHRETLFRLAIERRLPTVTGQMEYLRAGALVAYALDFVAIWRRSARYVSEILRGADPASLPIEQPTETRFGVNMRTARALGLAIPPSMLARADEVIE